MYDPRRKFRRVQAASLTELLRGVADAILVCPLDFERVDYAKLNADGVWVAGLRLICRSESDCGA